LIESSKRIVFRNQQLSVSWLGGAYTQQYSLVSEMTIELKYREDPRAGVVECLRIRQGRHRCMISISVFGFEQLCIYLREVF